jgi:hypothetical protein
MISRRALELFVIALFLGCRTVAPYKIEEDSEVNTIRAGLDPQKAIEIIESELVGWEGCTDEHSCNAIGQWRQGTDMDQERYTSISTVSSTGVKFRTHGVTTVIPRPNMVALEQPTIDYDAQFEFSEIVKLRVLAATGWGTGNDTYRNGIMLYSSSSPWYMSAGIRGGRSNVEGRKRVVAALKILCRNLSAADMVM